MKKHLLGLVGSLVFASLVHGLPAGAVSIPFSTSQAQFLAGDAITILEVLATSPSLTPGTTVIPALLRARAGGHHRRAG